MGNTNSFSSISGPSDLLLKIETKKSNRISAKKSDSSLSHPSGEPSKERLRLRHNDKKG